MPSTRPIHLGALVVLLLAGCGASAAEVRRAQTSGYDTDFAVVFSETLEAVRALYPSYVENPSAGWIKTSWHPLKVAQGQSGDDPLQTTANPPGNNPFSSTNLSRYQYFIRFRVDVLGGRPWRVRVIGEASVWEAGAVPSPLKGAETPHWLRGRTEALQLAIYQRLEKYAVPIAAAAPVVAAEPEAKPDLSVFGAIPPEAAQLVKKVRDAAHAGDHAALRAAMAERFTWSLGAEASADQAIAMWQADASVLRALVEVLDQGCRLNQAINQVTCPPAHGTDPGYLGYRAGFERVGSEWKWVFFVQGD